MASTVFSSRGFEASDSWISTCFSINSTRTLNVFSYGKNVYIVYIAYKMCKKCIINSQSLCKIVKSTQFHDLSLIFKLQYRLDQIA